MKCHCLLVVCNAVVILARAALYWERHRAFLENLLHRPDSQKQRTLEWSDLPKVIQAISKVRIRIQIARFSFHYCIQWPCCLLICHCSYCSFFVVRDRVRSKMERDILAEVNHPFIVKLHYGNYDKIQFMFVLKLVGELWLDVLHFHADTPCPHITLFLTKA